MCEPPAGQYLYAHVSLRRALRFDDVPGAVQRARYTVAQRMLDVASRIRRGLASDPIPHVLVAWIDKVLGEEAPAVWDQYHRLVAEAVCSGSTARLATAALDIQKQANDEKEELRRQARRQWQHTLSRSTLTLLMAGPSPMSEEPLSRVRTPT